MILRANHSSSLNQAAEAIVTATATLQLNGRRPAAAGVALRSRVAGEMVDVDAGWGGRGVPGKVLLRPKVGSLPWRVSPTLGLWCSSMPYHRSLSNPASLPYGLRPTPPKNAARHGSSSNRSSGPSGRHAGTKTRPGGTNSKPPKKWVICARVRLISGVGDRA